MTTFKYPRLFEPLRIGKTFFPNRIFSTPQDNYRLTYEGFLDESATAFYELKALGGYGSVFVGDWMIDGKLGRTHQFQLVGDDILARGSFTRTANAIRRHGAAAGAELNHGGMNAMISLQHQDFIWGVSDGEAHGGVEIRAWSEEGIQHVIDQYVQAATFAVQCGFNFIDIHAGHGWLPAQFLSTKFNNRTDRWGGSFENRSRFLVGVLEAIRKRIGPQIPIEVRLSGSEGIPGGIEIEETIEAAKVIDGLADIIHVSAGHHELPSASMMSQPTLFDKDGVNVHFAVDVKKHVKQSLVSTVGALTSPDELEEILASGKADIVNLGRQTLADPFLPLKARTGREDEVIRCLRCMTCFSTSVGAGIFYCAVNPLIGHERDSLNETPAPAKKKVLVAGGGVGGMQAALTAARRGHEVILLEKKDRLGGVLDCERTVPFKDKIAAYLDTQALLVSRAGVDVRLNTPATEDVIRQIAPDVLIAAIGGQPIKPPIPGLDGENVYESEEIYRNTDLAKKNVVILGGGLVGLELGVYLAQLDRDVTVVEMQGFALSMMGEMDTSEMINNPDLLSPGLNIVGGVALGVEVKKYPNLDIRVSTKALEVNAEGVKVRDPDGERIISADTVIYALGSSPLAAEAEAWHLLAPEFYQIGDCVIPANIQAATSVAYQIARDIGRI